MGNWLQQIVMGIIVMSIVVVGLAMADPSISAVSETQGITVTTTVSHVGQFSESQEMSWQISTGPLDSQLDDFEPTVDLGDGWSAIFLDIPVVEDFLSSPGEVQYTTVYTESTSTTGGFLEYSKSFSADTANKAIGTNNVQAHRNIQYSTVDGNSQMSSSEKLVLDGTGKMNTAEDVFLCPFAESKSPFVPEFCNIVQAGSNQLLTIGSLVTDANERHVSPTGDFPVTANYAVSLTGLGDIPAMGSTSAFMQVHAQEGRVEPVTDIPNPLQITDDGGVMWIITDSQGADMTYSENLAANGVINKFQADMQYQSGAIRI
ncbi:MAG: hypothetical protein LUQ69_00155 [Methanoregulaceae archaeon]|nr:hypothetical protein [Methanoregulaceae archaeon]